MPEGQSLLSLSRPEVEEPKSRRKIATEIFTHATYRG